jgi:hypothetical protein
VNTLFSPFARRTPPQKTVIIISGLPRSGTSMMMKMIVEGGIKAISDGIRRADADNPNGYYELETVKQLPQGDFSWLQEADGKAVKIISSLLEYLPHEYSYKIIFMEREITEILASQQKMLTHRDAESQVDDALMKQQFQNHLISVKAWLVRQPNIEVLYVNFNALIAEPTTFCSRIADFIGVPLNTERMLGVPNEKLYRNRLPTEST